MFCVPPLLCQGLGGALPFQPLLGLRQSPKANVLLLWLVYSLNTLPIDMGSIASCLIFLYRSVHNPLSTQAGLWSHLWHISEVTGDLTQLTLISSTGCERHTTFGGKLADTLKTIPK